MVTRRSISLPCFIFPPLGTCLCPAGVSQNGDLLVPRRGIPRMGTCPQNGDKRKHCNATAVPIPELFLLYSSETITPLPKDQLRLYRFFSIRGTNITFSKHPSKIFNQEAGAGSFVSLSFFFWRNEYRCLDVKTHGRIPGKADTLLKNRSRQVRPCHMSTFCSYVFVFCFFVFSFSLLITRFSLLVPYPSLLLSHISFPEPAVQFPQ